MTARDSSTDRADVPTAPSGIVHAARMLPPLREALLALQRRDLSVRAELAADGSLFDGYHPRMEAVHRENAHALRLLISEHGWPNEAIAGEDGAEAAWLVVQHAIAEPAFMRSCRALLAKEVAGGRVPRWQHAYLDDRIRVVEGMAQRFGTQFDLAPDGPVLCKVEDPAGLDERRHAVGLGPLRDPARSSIDQPRPSIEEFERRKAVERAWRVQVGWCLAGGH